MMSPDQPTPTFWIWGGDVVIRSSARIIAQDNIGIGSHVMIDDFVFVGGHRRISVVDNGPAL